MKLYLKINLLLIIVLLSAGSLFAQGTNCNSATPFCSDASLSFPNNTNVSVQNGPNYGCLQDPNLMGMQNPSWHYLQVNNGGTLEIEINQQGNGQGLDLDFAMWGPYTDMNAGCAAVMSGSVPPIQCSSDPDDTETIGIGVQGGGNYWSQQYASSINGQSTPPPAQAGEYYIVIITNASNTSGTITFDQVGGTGDTNCDIVTNPDHCDITNLTASAACNGNNTTITGSFTIDANYTTGTVTVSSTCGGSQTFTAADWSGGTAVLNFSIDGGPGNGSNCTINVSFSEDTGCSATTSITKPDCNPCSTTLSPTSATLCENETTTITASDAGGTWSSSNTAVATVSNGVVTAVGNGQATITYDTGTCQVTATITVSGQVTPTFTNPGPICDGEALSLPTTSSNGITGTWSPAVNNTQTTTYTFHPTAGQCSSDTSLTVEVHSNVVPTFNNPGPICEGETFTLPTTSNNGITGAWTPAIDNTQTTTYIFVTNDTTGCASNGTMTVVVSNFNFTSDVTATNTIVNEGNSTQLNVTLTPYVPGILFDWNPSETLNCTDCPNPVATPEEPTWYYVTLTTPEGCSYKDSIFIDYRLNCGDIYIPNVFSPNDDGENDIFKPYGRCLAKGEMVIFNRWGQKVFTSEDLESGWDGTINGKLANTDVYHYIIKTTSIYEEREEFKGTVTLVR